MRTRAAVRVAATGLIEAQRGYLFPWVPVCLAIGIGAYFALRTEPGLEVYAGTAALGVAGMVLARVLPVAGPFGVALSLIALGFGLAGGRAHLVAAPVLEGRYYGPVEGRIVAIDRSASDALRLTLDRVRLGEMAGGVVPARVRLSLHGPPATLAPAPGQRIMTTAHLAPARGPVEPGGFDFQRHAWFQRLGGVGYTRNPVLLAEMPVPGPSVFRLRLRASAAIQAAIPGEAGTVAAAILTGDRSAIAEETTEALRRSNLAHLLAISGLHMGLLTGFVFVALRVGLALWPALALRVPVKKIAAAGAILAGAAYLVLSGGNVATERAFVMIAVMFGAVLADRRAISLQSVALAAVVVLVLRPEALLGPGFQMSFAATTALVAAFGVLRGRTPRAGRVWPAVVATVISSAVAGAATAPVAAAHFNRVADYGLIANLLTVPLMGALVMPAGVVAVCLAPLGLSWVGFMAMEAGLTWILAVAHWMAELPGAVSHVWRPPQVVLPLLALGFLFAVLWQGRLRWAGLVPMLAAAGLWAMAERPVLLIADTGGLIGAMTGDGRALSKERGEGFLALAWLENDGDGADQAAAFARAPPDGVFHAGPVTVRHVGGRGLEAAAAESCAVTDWVVVPRDMAVPGGCRLLTPESLSKTGTIAVYLEGGKLREVTAVGVTGDRLWTRGGQ